jgi:hypothetical protein
MTTSLREPVKAYIPGPLPIIALQETTTVPELVAEAVAMVVRSRDQKGTPGVCARIHDSLDGRDPCGHLKPLSALSAPCGADPDCRRNAQ